MVKRVCVEVCLLRGGDPGIGLLMDAVMGSVDQAAVRSDVQWRTDLGNVIVREVLTRFRGLANPLGHQRGVLLEGVDHPLNLGQEALFVNRPTTSDRNGQDHDGPYLVPAITGGIEIHIDEKLDPGANRLMEMWKGAAQTKEDEPGVTSLSMYDVCHDEIVILQTVGGMRIRGDMRGFHAIPHYVP